MIPTTNILLVTFIYNASQVLISLHYYALGSFLKVIADTMGVSKASVSRSLLAVSRYLERMSQDWIVFPTRNTDLNVSNA